MTVKVGRDANLVIHLHDGYWARLLSPSFVYEPEVGFVLERCLPRANVFVDGGANIGYWSVLASRCATTIAVEPAPTTRDLLERNCALNGNRFRVVGTALWNNSGQVTLNHTGANHVGDSLILRRGVRPDAQFRVPAARLDALFLAEELQSGPVILKLDVEGAEVEALQGARNLLSRDVLIIYEDHGADTACRPTQYILNHLQMAVRTWHDGAIVPIFTVEDAKRIKRDPYTGYNFFAFKEGSIFESDLRPSGC